MKLHNTEALLEQARILILRDQACMLVRQVIDDVIMAAQRRPTLAQRREKEAERLTEIRALESRLAELKAGGAEQKVVDGNAN